MSTPCVSCGASIPDGQTCGRCAPASGKWTILAGNERLELDRASLRAALISGKVLGNDRILDNGREVLVAAHPAFRTWFVAGHKDALPSRGARRWWLAAAVVVVAGAAGGLALRNQAVPDPGAVAAAIDAAANPAPPPPPPLDPKILEPMRARVGAVHRVAPMLTEAETQLRAGETDLAIAAAERAVVADPDRVDALGLLLTLYAETNRFPEAWQPLLDAAMARSPNDPSTRRAQSALALARGDLPGAEAAAQDCLKDTRDSVICREALAAAREAMASDAASAIPVLAELDAIVAVEPDNVRVRRRAALLAAKVDAPGAEARLDALIQETDDRTLLEARARLAVLDADLDLARKLAKKLDPPGDPVLCALARLELAEGAPAAARKTLARRVGADDPATTRLRARIALAEGKGKEARPFADLLAKDEPSSPAVVQLRIAAALAAGDEEGAVAAGAKLDPERGLPLDGARALVAVGAADLARNRPQDAAIAFDRAVALEGSDPETHLWRMAAAAQARDPQHLTAAAQAALSAVDGRATQRRLHDGADVLAPPVARLRADIAEAYGDDPARSGDRALASSVAAWLAGDRDAARAGIDAAATAGDPFALALRARLTKDPASAVADLEAALTLRPKEVAWRLAAAEALLAAGRVDDAAAALAEARSGAVPELTARRLAARIADARKDRPAADIERRAILAAEPGDVETRRALRAP